MQFTISVWKGLHASRPHTAGTLAGSPRLLLFVSSNGWAVALTSDLKIHTLLGGEEAGWEEEAGFQSSQV